MARAECSSCSAQLMRQVAAIYERGRAHHAGAAEDGSAAAGAMEADEVAEALLGLGHSVTVRTALGGGGGGECLRNLRHVFLSVRLQVGSGPVLYCQHCEHLPVQVSFKIALFKGPLQRTAPKDWCI